MASITDSTQHGFLQASDATAVDTAITLTLHRSDCSHYIAAVEFYTSSAATTAAFPTAGTATFTVFPAVLPAGSASDTGVSLTNGAVSVASTNGIVAWAGNTLRVRVALGSLTANGATHYILRVNGVRG